MENREELDAFLEKADELINCKYILADIKIAGLLKTIACSKTLMAIIKNSFDGFDFNKTVSDCFKSSFDDETRFDFIEPETTYELIAFTFTLLLQIDDKKIVFSDFLKKYFYGDGSVFSCYSIFISSLIKPFKNSIRIIFEGIINGKIRNAEDEIKIYQKERTITIPLDEEKKVNESELNKVKNLLKNDKSKILISGLGEESLKDITLVLDGMMQAIDEADKSRIRELFIAYKYFSLIYRRLGLNTEELQKLLTEGKAL